MVDVAPFVAGFGGLAHVSQVHSFGFTAPASVFRNVKTMTAMHRAVIFSVPLVFAAQARKCQGLRNIEEQWSEHTIGNNDTWRERLDFCGSTA